MLEFLETETDDSEKSEYSFDREDYDEVVFVPGNHGHLNFCFSLSS